jgi:hypothetical protein
MDNGSDAVAMATDFSEETGEVILEQATHVEYGQVVAFWVIRLELQNRRQRCLLIHKRR